jgi:hypothetical protein
LHSRGKFQNSRVNLQYAAGSEKHAIAKHYDQADHPDRVTPVKNKVLVSGDTTSPDFSQEYTLSDGVQEQQTTALLLGVF